MYILLISLVLGFFAALLFVNFYFRWRVLHIYHELTRAQVHFEARHIFNAERLKAEILPKYPASREHILTFVRYLHFSMKMAAALIALITLFGLILMYYSRNGH